MAGVEPARSTAEALELADVNDFDLIISDIDRIDRKGDDGLKGLKSSASPLSPQAGWLRRALIAYKRTQPIQTASGPTNTRSVELLQ